MPILLYKINVRLAELKTLFTLLIFLLFSIAIDGNCQEQEFDKKIEIIDLKIGDTQSLAFSLKNGSLVRIEGKALSLSNDKIMSSFGWIIDGNTREIVWEMDKQNASYLDKLRTRENRFSTVTFDEIIQLPEGNYELYYSHAYPIIKLARSFPARSFSDIFNRKEKVLQELLSSQSLGMSVSGSSDELVEFAHEELLFNKSVIFSLTPAQDNNYLKQLFTLEKESRLRVYGIGEFASFEQKGNDYGWITEKETGKKVWEMTRSTTVPAGGDRKNRKVDTVLELPQGSFVAHFVTDGSHSYNSWNAAPPIDPNMWGITFLLEKEDKNSDIALASDRNATASLISFSRVENDMIVSQGFSLKQHEDIYIYSIGESNYKLTEMLDLGLIIDADTRGVVWEMSMRNTEFAGGTKKNRMFRKTISLNAGNYIVYYKTDLHHSFGNWVESPPYDPDSWGISLKLVNNDADNSQVELFEPGEYIPKNSIIRMVGIRDGMKVKKSFTLDESKEIKIFAIGEGLLGEMADYCWIERSDNEDIVWEMTYNMTDHAGGAIKNRKVDKTIILDKGRYTVYYFTDDSHAFNKWNDTPPDDPESYGITIIRLK